jgi:predicted amidohydrolase YtcJ
MGVLITCGLLALSQSLDGFDRKLKGLEIAISHQTYLNANALEEIAELGIPIMMFLTLSAYFRKNTLLENAVPDEKSSAA